MPLEIQWYRHGCFRLRGSQGCVVTDPFPGAGVLGPGLKGTVVTLSRPVVARDPGLPRAADIFVIDGPGEYERGGIFVIGLAIGQARLTASEPNPSVAYHITLDEVAICHLGELGHRPTQTEVEALGSIDVLLVPIGGGNMLNATRAVEVVSLIEPKIVVPMHYPHGESGAMEAVERFRKEIGVTDVAPQDALRVVGGRLPEAMQVVVLQPRR